MGIVVIWDPCVRSTTEAMLSFKAADAAWKEGDPKVPDLRFLLVPLDKDKESQLDCAITGEGGRAWVEGKLLIRGHDVVQSRHKFRQGEKSTPSSAGTLPPSKVSFVSPADGRLGINRNVLAPFLDATITTKAAQELLMSVERRFQQQDSPAIAGGIEYT